MSPYTLPVALLGWSLLDRQSVISHLHICLLYECCSLAPSIWSHSNSRDAREISQVKMTLTREESTVWSLLSLLLFGDGTLMNHLAISLQRLRFDKQVYLANVIRLNSKSLVQQHYQPPATGNISIQSIDQAATTASASLEN